MANTGGGNSQSQERLSQKRGEVATERRTERTADPRDSQATSDVTAPEPRELDVIQITPKLAPHTNIRKRTLARCIRGLRLGAEATQIQRPCTRSERGAQRRHRQGGSDCEAV